MDSDVEITDEDRETFFTYVNATKQAIRRLRLVTWWAYGCSAVVIAVSTWMIVVTRIFVVHPGGGYTALLLPGTNSPAIFLFAAGIALVLYCLWAAKRKLKRQQMNLKEARDAGLQVGLSFDD